MSRWVHPLKKTIPAVVEAVEKMGKIKIMFPTDSVTLGNWVSELTPLLSENQSGVLFLETKALVRWVKDFFVVFTWNNRCLRKAGQNLAALG